MQFRRHTMNDDPFVIVLVLGGFLCLIVARRQIKEVRKIFGGKKK